MEHYRRLWVEFIKQCGLEGVEVEDESLRTISIGDHFITCAFDDQTGVMEAFSHLTPWPEEGDVTGLARLALCHNGAARDPWPVFIALDLDVGSLMLTARVPAAQLPVDGLGRFLDYLANRAAEVTAVARIAGEPPSGPAESEAVPGPMMPGAMKV